LPVLDILVTKSFAGLAAIPPSPRRVEQLAERRAFRETI
jgi:hypothetical protein